MHDIRAIRENPEAFDDGLRRRGLSPRAESLIALDEKRRAAIAALQHAQERRNAASKQIGIAMARKDMVAAEEFRAQVADAKAKCRSSRRRSARRRRRSKRNSPRSRTCRLDDTPEGKDESDNVELRRWGARPALDGMNKPKEHFEIGEALGLMDFETAAKLSGARFVVLKGALARLERALEQFMLDLHTGEHGYTEIAPPVLVRDAAMFGTAQLPKFENDQFWAVGGELLRAPSDEEVALLDPLDAQAALVSRLVQDQERPAWSDPHRRSAADQSRAREHRRRKNPAAALHRRNVVVPGGSGRGGEDTRGMIRQHQFRKVELVSITTPEQSRDEHERMTACAEEVLKRLGLHYRFVALSTGDIGFASQKTYDLEVWLPGQGRFREISSCSICGDFQARRMNARFKAADAKSTRFVHTLNGSGVAVGRALVAILEKLSGAGRLSRRPGSPAALHGRARADRAIAGPRIRGPEILSGLAGPDQLLADIIAVGVVHRLIGGASVAIVAVAVRIRRREQRARGQTADDRRACPAAMPTAACQPPPLPCRQRRAIRAAAMEAAAPVKCGARGRRRFNRGERGSSQGQSRHAGDDRLGYGVSHC